MADIEERVAALEREVASLKERQQISDEKMQAIPDLIKTEFRLTNSQIARLTRDVADLQGIVGGLRGKVEVLPRVVAARVLEMLA